jgi:hypothetical protein
MYLRTCGSFKSTNYKKLGGKSQIRKVTHLQKIRKSNNLFKSANLRICYLRNLFAGRLPLLKGFLETIYISRVLKLTLIFL